MIHYEIYKAGGILISDRKILVEKEADKQFFVAPGGKVEHGESPTQALIRELREEFDITTNESDFDFMGTFYAPASGELSHRTLKMDVYFVRNWIGTPAPNETGQEIKWINSDEVGNIPIGSIFEKEVIPKLIELGLID